MSLREPAAEVQTRARRHPPQPAAISGTARCGQLLIFSLSSPAGSGNQLPETGELDRPWDDLVPDHEPRRAGDIEGLCESVVRLQRRVDLRRGHVAFQAIDVEPDRARDLIDRILGDLPR